MLKRQTTVAREVEVSGIGLHSGKQVQLRIKPAGVDSGIVFQRSDNPTALPVAAHPLNISSTELCTTIGTGPSRVSTIEHLMAALVGMEIDNALIEVSAPELPILDGSSAPFVKLLTSAGTKRLSKARQVYLVKKKFTYRSGDRVISVEPWQGRLFDCTINYPSCVIGKQRIEFELENDSFREIAECRTFCHIDDVEKMQSAGLALGGSLHNAVVVSDECVLNAEGLRVDDEFARHKLLDCVGDLGLLGAPLIGKITVVKPGHGLHAEFIKELHENLEDYVVPATQAEVPQVKTAFSAKVPVVAFG